MLTTATAVGAAIWLVYGLWQALGYVTPGAATVLAHAALIGLVVGLIKEAGFVRGQAGQEPGRFRLRLRFRNRAGIARKPSGQSLHEFFKGIVVGAVVGLVAGQGLVSELSAGLVIGLVGGVAGAALDERAALRARMDGEMFKVIAALATTAIAIPVAFTFSIELPLGMVAGVLAAGPSVREYRLWRGIPLGFLVLTTDGLFAGIAVGVAFGLVNVAVSALGEAHEPDAADPWILLSTDRSVTLVQTILAVPAIVLAAVLVLDAPIETGILYGLFGGIVRLVLSAWGSWLLFTRLWLPLTGRLPLRPKHFLEDAYQRGILRRTGATYQFRHARLRDHLRALPPPGAGRHQAR